MAPARACTQSPPSPEPLRATVPGLRGTSPPLPRARQHNRAEELSSASFDHPMPRAIFTRPKKKDAAEATSFTNRNTLALDQQGAPRSQVRLTLASYPPITNRPIANVGR